MATKKHTGSAGVTVNGTAEEVAALGKLMNEHGLTLAELVEKAVPKFIQDKIDANAEEGDGQIHAAPTPPFLAAMLLRRAHHWLVIAMRRAETMLRACFGLEGQPGCRPPHLRLPDGSPALTDPVAAGSVTRVVRNSSGTRDSWFDTWAGTADALVTAGLATIDEFPGQPGRPSTIASYRPAAGKQGAYCWFRAPGYRRIARSGNGFRIDVTVSVAEQERRTEELLQRHQAGRAKFEAECRDRAQAQEAAMSAAASRAPGRPTPQQSDEIKRTDRSARPSHLRMVWSAPAAGTSA